MSPDEMLLDPLRALVNGHEFVRPSEQRVTSLREAKAAPQAAPHELDAAAAAGDPARVVPPVRTIVVERPPEPVAPPREREPLRAASATGPERLRLEGV